MLNCCHCLCNKEYDLLYHVQSCYPSDDRVVPVESKLREFIIWGTHDIMRMSNINDVLTDIIRSDIHNNKINRIIVGVGIYGKVLESIPDVNAESSNGLSCIIILLLKTEKPECIEIASHAIFFLLKYTRMMLDEYVQRIIHECLRLTECDDLSNPIYELLSKIIENSTLLIIPVFDLLFLIKDNFLNNIAANNILCSLSQKINLLTIQKFVESSFYLFDEVTTWNDENYLLSFLNVIFNELDDECSIQFYRLIIEHIESIMKGKKNLKMIIVVSKRLKDEIKPFRLFSSTQSDLLLMILSFILNISKKEIENKKLILDLLLDIFSSISSFYSHNYLFKISHKQIWETLPGNSSYEYSKDEFILIFKAISIFYDSIKDVITKKLIDEGLKKLLSFILAYQNHPEEIYCIILDHLKKVNEISDDKSHCCVIQFLLTLQRKITKLNDISKELPFHTFIMCAMKDLIKFIPKQVEKHIRMVIQSRIENNPPMIDCSLNYVSSYFPELVKSKDLPESIILFQDSISNIELNNQEIILTDSYSNDYSFHNDIKNETSNSCDDDTSSFDKYSSSTINEILKIKNKENNILPLIK